MSTSDPIVFPVFQTSGLTAPFTWMDMSLGLADGMVNALDTSSEDLFVAKIQFRATSSSPLAVETSQVWDGPDLKITVYGKSIMTLQNRTDSGNASTVITSNEANPLRGKEYLLRGSGGRVRDFRYTATGGNYNMLASSNTGVIFVASNQYSGEPAGS